MINQLINLWFLSVVQTAVPGGDTWSTDPQTPPTPTAGHPWPQVEVCSHPLVTLAVPSAPRAQPNPINGDIAVLVPSSCDGGHQGVPSWGVVTPVSPLGKWTGVARAVLVPSALMLQARSQFACAWRGHSRRELPKVGELFMAGLWWHCQLHFSGSKDAVSPVKFR